MMLLAHGGTERAHTELRSRAHSALLCGPADLVPSRKNTDGQDCCEEESSSAKAQYRFHEAGYTEHCTGRRGLVQVDSQGRDHQKLWAYIKKNGLQDSKNKRANKADAALKVVFGGRATVNMFKMTKLVGTHLK